MPIAPKDVAKVAKLSRLHLDDAKLERFAGQMDDILAYMETLGSLDTSGVEPLYSPVEHSTPYRADEPVQKNMHSDVLANAPETDGQFFVVPRIV